MNVDFKVRFPRIAKEGFGLIAIFASVTFILFFLNIILGFIGIILTCWCVLFFRDPERVSPKSKSLVVAPADGKIIAIEKVIPPLELGFEDEMLKISIFMNVFNVHVNRSPCEGKIKQIIYNKGKFFNASLDKASIDNERQGFIVKTSKKGQEIAFVQIAGLVARRIVCFVKEGDKLEVGQRVGLIKFGSRVDVYLPTKVIPVVSEGQITVAGETILADLDNLLVKESFKHQIVADS